MQELFYAPVHYFLHTHTYTRPASLTHMNWYIRSHGSAPIGPVSTEELQRDIAAGRVPPDATVMSEADGTWRPLTVVPELASVRVPAPGYAPVTAAPTTPAQPAVRPVIAVAGFLFLLVPVGLILLSSGRSSTPPVVTMTATTATARPLPTPEVKREPTVAERLKKATLLPEALGIIQAQFEDTQDKPDPATSLFALWMGDNPSWSAIQRLPETTHARVLKDSESERGKRLCISGTVLQISKEQGTKLFSGTLMSDDMKPIFYIATASTGDLVGQSRAKFCGVVTGRYSYSNVSGGTTHAIRLVGLFDLPENRKLLEILSGQKAHDVRHLFRQRTGHFFHIDRPFLAAKTHVVGEQGFAFVREADRHAAVCPVSPHGQVDGDATLDIWHDGARSHANGGQGVDGDVGQGPSGLVGWDGALAVPVGPEAQEFINRRPRRVDHGKIDRTLRKRHGRANRLDPGASRHPSHVWRVRDHGSQLPSPVARSGNELNRLGHRRQGPRVIISLRVKEQTWAVSNNITRNAIVPQVTVGLDRQSHGRHVPRIHRRDTGPCPTGSHPHCIAEERGSTTP